MKLLICSDLHYAGPLEKQRMDYEVRGAANAAVRLMLRFYRRHFWLRDPFAHNHLLERVLEPDFEPDLVVANGDYSCDTAFIGVADAAARQSAEECLGKLRGRFGGKLRTVIGDHELGKRSLSGGHGGLRMESYEITRGALGLDAVWTERIGRWALIATTSTLAAMPVYEREALESERGAWRELAREHLEAVAAAFRGVKTGEKILLFCHDPTALPFLWGLPEVRERAGQIERTIIGHLHSEVILRASGMLAGMPRIAFCGSAVRRMSAALSAAREWRHFRILLCPSLAGIEFNQTGGYLTAELEPEAAGPAEFTLHPIRRGAGDAPAPRGGRLPSPP